MRIGVMFPSFEIGGDPVGARDWAQAAEDLGYDNIWVYEHVLGFTQNPAVGPGGPVTPRVTMDEPFVLLGFLAAITRRVGLVTGVVVLPQRQTALVAKQAAEVDALSGGRLRLGVGVGQVARETEALGVDFHTRGRRMDEQLILLRRLWTEEGVTFEGRWHHIPDGGGLTGPRPVQRPIPIWIGGRSEVAMQRAARVADGWMPLFPAPDDQARARVDAFRACTADAGRLPDEVGLEVWGPLAGMTESDWPAHAAGWRELGATHYAVFTSGMGLSSVHAHIEQLRRVREVLADEFAVAA